MKNILKFIACSVFIASLSSSCIFKTADIRTTVAKNTQDETKARQLLQEMAIAHGLNAWNDVETYEVSFEDEFFGFIGKQGNPFKQDKTAMKIQYISNSYDGQLTILTGEEKDLTWGIQSWKTYTIAPEKEADFQQNDEIYFWLPTYQYFIEFPFRIQRADAVNYAGTSVINNINCEGILASWNTTAPQKEIDQYLIWINSETKQIVKLEYTIREFYKFLTGAVYFQYLKNYDGILLPSVLPVESSLSKKNLHEMRIKDFKINPVTVEKLRPNKKLPLMGDAKEE
ncbi:MAG: hypothetical protein AAFO82_01740 [Bacteroidota bacterium]